DAGDVQEFRLCRAARAVRCLQCLACASMPSTLTVPAMRSLRAEPKSPPAYRIDLEKCMLRWFENLLHPYQDAQPATPPSGFVAFVWACTKGARRYILAMTLLTAMTGALEALLFAMMGHVVDWLGKIAPAQLWELERGTLLLLGIVVLLSSVLVALQTFFKHQTLAGNFPMQLRWNFHRLMLNQSMGFYQDEFAGRITAKVMQTALAVRDVCMIAGDILVFVVIYFVTLAGV